MRRNQQDAFDQFNDLSRYNSEKARGLVHTPFWEERMAKLQEAWDALNPIQPLTRNPSKGKQ